jgi:hypothetical protein
MRAAVRTAESDDELATNVADFSKPDVFLPTKPAYRSSHSQSDDRGYSRSGRAAPANERTYSL